MVQPREVFVMIGGSGVETYAASKRHSGQHSDNSCTRFSIFFNYAVVQERLAPVELMLEVEGERADELRGLDIRIA